MIPMLQRALRVQHTWNLPLRTCQATAAAAFVLEVVGTNLAWATYTGFPGLMSLSFYPAGARSYVLALSLALGLVAVRFTRRRQAGIWASLASFAVTLQTLIAISRDGGGLVNVSAGAWITLLGTILGIVAFIALPDDGAPLPSSWPRMPRVLDGLAVVAGIGAAMLLLVYGLSVDPANQFVALVIALIGGFAALNRLGLFAWLGALYARQQGLSLALIGLAAISFPFTQNGESYWLRVAANVGVLAAAAIGLNVVVGLAGLLDLGYIAFFGIGAYVAALYGNAGLGPSRGHIPFLLIVPLGALVSGVIGVIIGAPTLRLRGDYLAIVTLGFGEIFRIVVNTYDGFTGGPNGLANIPDLAFGSFNFGLPHKVFGITLQGFANYYWAELVLISIVVFVFSRLDRSRIGRAWVAIREDELAAAAMGINTVAYKLLAFGIGASVAGGSGTIQAHVATQVSPDSFVFMQSVLLLAAVVLGGMGTVPGALVGAAILYAVPEKLRAFSDYRLLIFGVLLILVMRFRPEGMIASKRRQREFHDTEASGADALSAPPGFAGAVP
jgi:branched-chain amino acid transport system permease protein